MRISDWSSDVCSSDLLPSASSAKVLDQPKSRVIAVSNDGTVSIDAVPVSMAELEGELRTSMASSPDLAVILRGDRAGQYDQIMQVLDLCSKVRVPRPGKAYTRPPASAAGGGAGARRRTWGKGTQPNLRNGPTRK